MAVFCYLGSNIEQLNFVDAWKGHRSFVFMMCYWANTSIGHRQSSCFTVAQHFGNSLQYMFYRQCPMFTTCVSYSTLHIFDLNFWSHLLSMNANQECRKKFPSQRPVFILSVCTVPCIQSIKCQVHCLETSHMWPLCSVERQLAGRLRSCRLWMWESVHGGVHYNRWHPPN